LLLDSCCTSTASQRRSRLFFVFLCPCSKQVTFPFPLPFFFSSETGSAPPPARLSFSFFPFLVRSADGAFFLLSLSGTHADRVSSSACHPFRVTDAYHFFFFLFFPANAARSQSTTLSFSFFFFPPFFHLRAVPPPFSTHRGLPSHRGAFPSFAAQIIVLFFFFFFFFAPATAGSPSTSIVPFFPPAVGTPTISFLFPRTAS